MSHRVARQEKEERLVNSVTPWGQSLDRSNWVKWKLLGSWCFNPTEVLRVFYFCISRI